MVGYPSSCRTVLRNCFVIRLNPVNIYTTGKPLYAVHVFSAASQTVKALSSIIFYTRTILPVY